MSITNLFDKIVGRQKQRERERVASYRDLVARVAAGEEPDAEVVDRVLLVNGKSLDDMKAAVELRQRRLALRGLMDAVPRLERERKGVESQLRAAQAVFDDARRAWDETATPLRIQQEQLAQQVRDAERAQDELENCCPDEELKTEFARVQKQRQLALDRAEALRVKTAQHQRIVRQYRERAGRLLDDDRKELHERADFNEKKVGECQEALRETEKELAGIEKQELLIREHMRRP